MKFYFQLAPLPLWLASSLGTVRIHQTLIVLINFVQATFRCFFAFVESRIIHRVAVFSPATHVFAHTKFVYSFNWFLSLLVPSHTHTHTPLVSLSFCLQPLFDSRQKQCRWILFHWILMAHIIIIIIFSELVQWRWHRHRHHCRRIYLHNLLLVCSQFNFLYSLFEGGIDYTCY